MRTIVLLSTGEIRHTPGTSAQLEIIAQREACEKDAQRAEDRLAERNDLKPSPRRNNRARARLVLTKQLKLYALFEGQCSNEWHGVGY